MTFHWSYLVVAFFVFEWCLRFIMLVVVPKNRRPTSASSWLLLIMLEPIIGSLLYASFGSPRLPLHRKRLQKYADAHIAKELAEPSLHTLDTQTVQKQLTASEEQFVKLNHSLGGLPVVGGNDIQFLDDYDAAIQALVKDLNKAKDLIYFEYFILVMDETSEPVLAALEAATARGVKVYVLFDAIACRHYPQFKQLKKRLTAAGIHWKPMLPFNLRPGKTFTRPDLRNHRKIVVIDGRIGFTGSQNIVNKNYHRKDDLYYEEVVARLEGPIVWQLAAVFRTDWYAETHTFLPAQAAPESKGSLVAQVLPSGPTHGGSNNLKLYTALMHAATRKIVIVTPYFVPDEALMTALTSAADRGVQVTMINSEAIDKVLVGHAQRSYYEELLSAGVRIFLYKKPVFLHTKHVTIDDSIAVVGSSNLDIRSFELDLEVSLVLYDKKAVTKLRAIENRYLEGSTEINEKAWARRPLWQKSLDSISRLTSALQ